jgi:hypothetical protein
MATQPIQPTKPCSKCGQIKPTKVEYFSPAKKARDGLHSWCKACSAAWAREDRARNKAGHTERERRRYLRHREKRLAYDRSYWERNREKLVEKCRRRSIEKREIYNANRRDKYAADPALRRERAEKFRVWRRAVDNIRKSNKRTHLL